MSLLTGHRVSHSALRPIDPDIDHPGGVARTGDGAPEAAEEQPPQVVASGGASSEVIAGLLHEVARGAPGALVALQHHIVGLVRINILRVLRDASRSDTVAEEFFAEVLREASDFDPDRDSAQAWLLMRAHQRAVSWLPSDHAGSCR